MLASELIERKRDGDELDDGDLRAFLDDYLGGRVAEYQMSALLMAVFFRGLSAGELRTLTRAIVDSGRRLDFRRRGPHRPSTSTRREGWATRCLWSWLPSWRRPDYGCR